MYIYINIYINIYNCALPSQHVQVGPSWACPPGNRMGLNLVSKWVPSGLAHL